MLPVFAKLGSLAIFTQGVFLVLALFWGLFFVWKYIQLTVYNEEKVFDLVFLGIFSALFFGRAGYFVFSQEAEFSLLRFILINAYPGFSFYAGLLGALGAIYLYSIHKNIKFLEILDYLSVGFLTAMGFVVLGRGFSGETVYLEQMPQFLAGAEGFLKTIPLFLMKSTIFFVSSYFAVRILMEIRRENLAVGLNFVFTLWVVSAVYYSSSKVENSSLYILGLRLNEVFSLFLFLTTAGVFVYYFRDKIFASFSTAAKNAFKKRPRGGKKKTDGAKEKGRR